MLRISAGLYKNRRVDVQEGTRPITERLRIQIFDLLDDFCNQANILDLYAGSGIMGFEALSRNASKLNLVERNENAIKIITKNIKTLNLANQQVNLYKQDVNKYLENCNENWLNDIIFVDPPFLERISINLKKIGKVLKPSGIIVLRLPKNYYKSQIKIIKKKSFEKVYEKNVGTSCIVFYKHKI